MHRPAGFFRQYVSNPSKTGAIAPSSTALASCMLTGLPLADADVVVELGPGSGALTRHLIEQVGENTRILAVEINPTFAEQVAERYPRVEVVNGDAIQSRLLDAVARSLRPGGCFVTFAYWGMHRFKKGRLFREQIESRFSRVERTGLVLRNLPPAFAYRCWR